MLTNSALIILGLALLVGGANVMIRGATALATVFRVPPVVIGLTIVAFGTSAPELVVNSTAAFSGQSQLAFGNIVGSCAINLGWVLAITALVRPIKVERSIISREIPMMILATAVFATLTADRLFDNAPENLLAESGMKRTEEAVANPEAVQHCLEALQHFAKLAPDDLQRLTLELAMAGRNGFAVHGASRRYRCKGLDGEFSGLAMVSYLYVAMQEITPGTDIGFDLSAEYEQAKRIFSGS